VFDPTRAADRGGVVFDPTRAADRGGVVFDPTRAADRGGVVFGLRKAGGHAARGPNAGIDMTIGSRVEAGN
jgi:hypothetical protein